MSPCFASIVSADDHVLQPANRWTSDVHRKWVRNDERGSSRAEINSATRATVI